MEKKLLLGNEAIARGAYEAGVRVASAYPGTPSTEITEYITEYPEIYAEWAPNEKVAAEVAIGASIAGGRAMCAMKHVGLNVAADPLFTASYTGVNGGLVICVADDQGMHSSQNEQDSRNYAIASKVPMLEPSDSAECKDYMKAAFELSERFDTPVLLRLCTRVSHSRSIVELGEVLPQTLKPYKKDMQKYVMMPAMARGRHVVVEKRMTELAEWAEQSDLNTTEINKDGTAGAKSIGIITAGIAYRYAKEALGDSVSYLKLGAVNPLPVMLIKDFCERMDKVYIVEELDPVIENHCRRLGLSVIGKEAFSLLGEYSAEMIARVVRPNVTSSDTIPLPHHSPTAEPLVSRPPVMCAGCPHRGVFYVLKQMKLTVMGDIGCYTLGALPPQQAMDTTICMGASIGMAHGMEKAIGNTSDHPQTKKTVAVIGDSTFLHSGITGLIDVVYNKGTSTVIILDNSITGMTGHQENPSTGRTIRGEVTKQVDLQKLCEAIGIERVVIADPFDVKALEGIIKTELEANEPSVIIARRPCKLLKGVDYKRRFEVDKECCKECGFCMNIGCPSLVRKNKRVYIESDLCTGCGYCQRVCKFDAVKCVEN